MSTIALLAFFLSYLLAPSHPITWALLAITFITLIVDTVRLARKALHG